VLSTHRRGLDLDILGNPAVTNQVTQLFRRSGDHPLPVDTFFSIHMPIQYLGLLFSIPLGLAQLLLG
jgi:hypothetical protein